MRSLILMSTILFGSMAFGAQSDVDAFKAWAAPLFEKTDSAMVVFEGKNWHGYKCTVNITKRDDNGFYLSLGIGASDYVQSIFRTRDYYVGNFIYGDDVNVGEASKFTFSGSRMVLSSAKHDRHLELGLYDKLTPLTVDLDENQNIEQVAAVTPGQAERLYFCFDLKKKASRRR